MMTANERSRAVALLLLMLIGMVFETLGVGLVIPALALMTQQDVQQRYQSVEFLTRYFGELSSADLVIAGMIGLTCVYAIKSAFLAFLAWRQMGFVYGLQAQISERLFAGYMRQPYTFHLQRNSAQLIRNTLGEVHNLTQYGVMQAVTLITEALMVSGIFALLIYVEPIGALLAVATLGAIGIVFYHSTHRRMLRWGQERQVHEGMRIQHLQQGLGGVKEIQLLGREEEFLARYRFHTAQFARIGRMQNTLQQLPRLGLELLAVSALCVLVVVMIGQGRPLESLLPTIGLFAAAAFRIMPSANRMMTALQITRHSLPVVDTLYAEMQLLNKPSATAYGPRLPFAIALTLENIYFCYPGADIDALRGVNLTITSGASVGFVGGSGAGKSTLVAAVLGLLKPDKGFIRVDEVDIQSNLRGWQDNIGYVPQHIYLTDDTLRRNIAFGLADEEIDDHAVLRALKAAQLEDFVAELPGGLDSMVGERGLRLSGGQLQRVGIARALYHDPPVLVLDEATSALDPTTERGVMDAVRALHGTKTVIIVAHRATTVEYCDFVYRLEAGSIVDSGEPRCIIPPSTAHGGPAD